MRKNPDEAVLLTTITGRTRKQPMPTPVLFEALRRPTSGHPRQWLTLQPGEQCPTATAATEPREVVWTTVWPDLTGAVIRFVIETDGPGSQLTWTLEIPDHPVADVRRATLTRRIDELVNRDLRLALGQ